MIYIHRLLLIFCVAYVAFLFAGFASQIVEFLWRYFFLRELPQLYQIYSGSSATDVSLKDEPRTGAKSGTWVVITGGSSGQGREFALQFARRGFNILLIGSIRSENTAKMIRNEGVLCAVVVKDFSQAFEPNFFDDIATAIQPLDVALLINNIGHRTGWDPYHEAPENIIRDTIACGTLVQARLTHMLLPQLLARLETNPQCRSAIVFITAQCSLPNTGFAIPGYVENPVTVPYLATYEASNAFGYYHAASIIAEYKKNYPRLDLLNITPGAVLTENTSSVLTGTPFAVNSEAFVSKVLTFLGGNVSSGTTCAYWGHAMTSALIGIAPWYKEPTLREVGKKISSDYMARYAKQVKQYEIKKELKTPSY